MILFSQSEAQRLYPRGRHCIPEEHNVSPLAAESLRIGGGELLSTCWCLGRCVAGGVCPWLCIDCVNAQVLPGWFD